MSAELRVVIRLATELQDSDFRMGVGCAAPESYEELLVITGIERGLENALFIYEKLNPRAAGELKMAGLWPGVGVGHWGAATGQLPDDFMDRVATSDSAVDRGTTPGGAKQHKISEKTAQKLRELDLEVETELGSNQSASATDCSAAVVASAVDALLKDRMELEQSLEATDRLDFKIQAMSIGGVDARSLARGDVLLGLDGSVNPGRFLNVIQIRERLHRERKFKFIVGLTFIIFNKRKEKEEGIFLTSI